jgi:hypothetical protein
MYALSESRVGKRIGGLSKIFVPGFEVSAVGGEPCTTGSSCFAVSTLRDVTVFAVLQWNLLVVLKV